jgi:hypothetical protein
MPIYTSTDTKLHSSWNEGLSSLYKSDYRNDFVQMVSVETLDNIINNLATTRVDVIKIDVEGAELQVLKGATETLKAFRPKIVMEINPSALAAADTSPLELVDFLNSFDYKTNIIYPNGKYEQISSPQSLDDCDVFCHP